MNTCSYGEDTLRLLRTKCVELAYNGSDTFGLENPPVWMGQALRFAPLLSACMRKARGGPIQTISPAFDGLKVFPSLVGLSIARFGRSSCSRLASPPVSQSTGFPHLPHSQEGYGTSMILRCLSIYLTSTPEPASHLIIFLKLFAPSQTAWWEPRVISGPADRRT
jgi:hypothetical protein